MVLRADRELLTRLAQINGEVPDLALRLMNGDLPVDEQRQFARRLADMAEALLAHADRRDQTVLEHEPPAPRAVAAAVTTAVPGEPASMRGRGDAHA